ncbi:hypothetical protein PAHAL_8G169100 [Panicum hallii]|uniref:Uncharacterized protein n=1 Tax=Panicum hallii TaxID=206008 RepID=A0A2T8I932_9POAL|nr:hypothetical protein PAHAL_8G169100 [Panicum hallii]
MPQPAGPTHSVLVAEELLCERLLHPPVHVVQEHVGVPLAAARARQGRRCPYRGHPPRRCREVPLRSVDHEHVPLGLVHLGRQVVQRQRARPVAAYAQGAVAAAGARQAGRAVLVGGEEAVGLVEARAVGDEVRAEERRLRAHDAVPRGVLLEEDGGAAGVERVPEPGVVAQAEHQQPQRCAAAEHGERQRDLVPRLLRHGLHCGVLHAGVGQRGHARLAVPGPGGRRDRRQARQRQGQRREQVRRQRRRHERGHQVERREQQRARAGEEEAAAAGRLHHRRAVSGARCSTRRDARVECPSVRTRVGKRERALGGGDWLLFLGRRETVCGCVRMCRLLLGLAFVGGRSDSL